MPRNSRTEAIRRKRARTTAPTALFGGAIERLPKRIVRALALNPTQLATEATA